MSKGSPSRCFENTDDRIIFQPTTPQEMEIKASRFIGEPIEVRFHRPPLFEKKPGCPDQFQWRGDRHEIVEKLKEWHDYHRRGRMASNVRPEHAAVAESRGSWGVGRDYFRVRTSSGRIFDLYYDRAPKNAGNRKGAWFLFREISVNDAEGECE